MSLPKEAKMRYNPTVGERAGDNAKYGKGWQTRATAIHTSHGDIMTYKPRRRSIKKQSEVIMSKETRESILEQIKVFETKINEANQLTDSVNNMHPLEKAFREGFRANANEWQNQPIWFENMVWECSETYKRLNDKTLPPEITLPSKPVKLG